MSQGYPRRCPAAPHSKNVLFFRDSRSLRTPVQRILFDFEANKDKLTSVDANLKIGMRLKIPPRDARMPTRSTPAPAAVSQPALWLLAAMVMCWVAGFDIIYALQDIAVDRDLGFQQVGAGHDRIRHGGLEREGAGPGVGRQ